MLKIQCAKVAHEINRAYCQALGDYSQPVWEDAPEWKKESAEKGVLFHYTHPNASPEDSHNMWLAEKTKTGWVYGEVKDVKKKQHPCMVPFDKLPREQQVKDHLFRAVVHALMF